VGHDGLDDNHVIQERRYTEQVVLPSGELAVYPDMARVLFADGARLDDLADLGLGYAALLHSSSGMVGKRYRAIKTGTMHVLPPSASRARPRHRPLPQRPQTATPSRPVTLPPALRTRL